MKARVAALTAFVTIVTGVVPLIGGGNAPSAGGISVGRVHKRFQPTEGKIFVLIIGNDARAGNPDSARADAIHIAGINTHTMKGGILNFPRDSYVSISGSGSGRINEALTRGGPTLLARTLERITGIRLDYWVMVGFEGFRGVIEDVGAVSMRIPFRIHDPTGSGANLKAGKQKLSPPSALAFVRTRHSFSGGDLARTANQAKFLIGMLKELRDDVARNPARLLQWISAARTHARFDLSPQELYRLGVLTALVKPGRVGIRTVPVSIGSVGAASVVFIQPGAQAVYQHFRKHASL